MESTGPDHYPGIYTANVGLLSYNWRFDASASSHMIDSRAQFTTYRAHYRTVTIGGNVLLSYYRIGILELQCLLPDNSISHRCLNNIIYVANFSTVSSHGML